MVNEKKIRELMDKNKIHAKSIQDQITGFVDGQCGPNRVGGYLDTKLDNAEISIKKMKDNIIEIRKFKE